MHGFIFAKNRVHGDLQVKVSLEDFERLSGFKWRWSGIGSKLTVYRYIRLNWDDPDRKRHKRIEICRDVLGNHPDGLCIDHINGDRSDNRRDNLRLVTPAQNAYNKGKPKGNFSSTYMGVYCPSRYKTPINGRPKVHIKRDRKCCYLGSYESEYLAAIAYDYAARKVFGDFARVNFPENTDYSEVSNQVDFYMAGNRIGASKYRGVQRSGNIKKQWRANIKVTGKSIFLGSFFSEEAAAKAYDEAALKYFGAAARLNFTTVPSTA